MDQRNEKNSDVLDTPISPRTRASRSPLNVALIIGTALLCLFIVFGGFLSSKSTKSSNRSSPASPASTEEFGNAGSSDASFNPTKRYSLEYGQVACWQHNGVWIARLTPVELSQLDINRFHDTNRSLSQNEEDKFCASLRTYGASFWTLPPRWPDHVNWCEDIDACVEPAKKVQLALGFTETGGVWVLDTSKGWDKLYPRSLGLKNAITMEERCQVIKDLGGKFCESMKACPETAALLEDFRGA